jgi:rhamnulose-1-phosphate aldolase
MKKQSLNDFSESVATVAGFLWQKGWAERNGGNISLRIPDEEPGHRFSHGKAEFPLVEPMPELGGHWYYLTGTGCRMRDVAVNPLNYGLLIRISEDGLQYEADSGTHVRPTSELPSHLAIHRQLQSQGKTFSAVVHTHPTELIALSHIRKFLVDGVLSRLLWSMIPETKIFVPRGIGIVPYILTGTRELADATIESLKNHDVVLWEKHGVLATGDDIVECFDLIDTLNKSAQIYLTAKTAGFEPEGLSDSQLDELAEAFKGFVK